jgi:hypothetical protein
MHQDRDTTPHPTSLPSILDFPVLARCQKERMQGGLSGGYKIRRSRLVDLGYRHVTTRSGHEKGTNQEGAGTSR